jgi:hypothetical protein
LSLNQSNHDPNNFHFLSVFPPQSNSQSNSPSAKNSPTKKQSNSFEMFTDGAAFSSFVFCQLHAPKRSRSGPLKTLSFLNSERLPPAANDTATRREPAALRFGCLTIPVCQIWKKGIPSLAQQAN